MRSDSARRERELCAHMTLGMAESNPCPVHNSDAGCGAESLQKAANGSRTGQRRGLVLGEVLVLVAMLVLVAVVLAVLLGDARRNAQMGQCQTNLRSYASSTGSYASDYEDLMWGFNWLPNQPNPSGWIIPSSPIQAHADQAAWIMKERGPLAMDQILSWIPHALFSHLVIEDYTSSPLPAPRTVCPSDVNPYKWNRDPLGYAAGQYSPSPIDRQFGSANNPEKRWAFISTYNLGAAFWDISTIASARVSMGQSQNQMYTHTNSKLGQPSLVASTFPSQKVLIAESHGFHHGTRDPYFEYPEARMNVLMVDGSVANRSTSDANPGWRPREPHLASSSAYYDYEWPLRSYHQWYPRPLNGLYNERVYTRIRWTRDGLKGRDFDGPEARTGQP